MLSEGQVATWQEYVQIFQQAAPAEVPADIQPSLLDQVIHTNILIPAVK